MKNCLYYSWVIIFLLSTLPCNAIADEDDDLFSDDSDLISANNGVSAEQPKLIFSGTIDSRLVDTGEAISWDRKGRGLTRYGGLDTDTGAGRDELGDRKTTAFKLPQITLVVDILVNENVSGYLQLNYDDHIDSSQSPGHLGIVESYINYSRSLENNNSVKSRLGLVIPPISLEHPNTGWNTLYTITPSAINTWVGEELRMIAFETNYHYDINTLYSIEFTAAPFSGNDPSGSILAWRGWAMHDYQLTTGSRLRAQTIAREDISPRGGFIEPIKEIDGNLAYYAKLSLNRAESWKMQLFYHDSNADEVTLDYVTMDYAWKTVFTHFALEWFPTDSLTVLFQGITGNTKMGGFPAVDNNYDAWYTLVGYQTGNHRTSLRYDAFRVEDIDTTKNDPNDSEGVANTLAYFYEWDDSQLLGAEYLHITSKRIGVENFDEDDDPKDDLLQLMYRITF